MCEFDEYEADTLHNQALKSVMVLLLSPTTGPTPPTGYSLGVCELVVRGLLPTQDAGTTKLASWVCALGPHCGDYAFPGVSGSGEKQALNPECPAPGGPWRVELLGKTYTRETWPVWPWDLL